VPSSSDPLHLAVAFDGTGWHPASWREADARPAELLTPGYWTDLVGEAERGQLVFATIEDGLTLQFDHPLRADDRVDRVRGRLDAVLIASRVAPTTKRIGLIPTAIATHTEPFHLSKAIATLDYVSSGRAGIRIQVSASPDAARLFGRRDVPDLSGAGLGGPDSAAFVDELFTEAAEYVEVLRRLWDSWEDDAEIRDVASGKFVDRNKLHYIDFHGTKFSVKGPSITPRPPQGQPLVAALAHGEAGYRLVGDSADIGFVTPHDASETAAIVDTISAHRSADADPVRVFADLVVFLDDTQEAAAARRARLDELAGAEYASDAEVFVGTPAQLADVLQQWHAAGAAGFRLRPAALPHDLLQITDGLVPELRRRGALADADDATTLRAALQLPRPANRYATT
jgi:alkanesulfonate monooxygenase SsuD/methylene tetrahydromethanopterin reductase-like flavin-dependent oxidoreductase (luciferase family)